MSLVTTKKNPQEIQEKSGRECVKWSDVYTSIQRRNLLAKTKRALQDFLAFLCHVPRLTEEVEIAGAYGLVPDKLVVVGHANLPPNTICERTWSYEADAEAKPPNPQYLYQPVLWRDADRIILNYSLTPEDIWEARDKIQKLTSLKQNAIGQSPDETSAIVSALLALAGSPAAWRLIRTIRLAVSKEPYTSQSGVPEFACLIMDTNWDTEDCGGLCHLMMGGLRRYYVNTNNPKELTAIAATYELSAEKLRQIKEMIEAT